MSWLNHSFEVFNSGNTPFEQETETTCEEGIYMWADPRNFQGFDRVVREKRVACGMCFNNLEGLGAHASAPALVGGPRNRKLLGDIGYTLLEMHISLA